MKQRGLVVTRAEGLYILEGEGLYLASHSNRRGLIVWRVRHTEYCECASHHQIKH